MTVNIGKTKRAIGTITRDMTAASGAVATTGLGFVPKIIRFNALVDNTTLHSYGNSDGTTESCIYDQHAITANTRSHGSIAILLAVNGSNFQQAAASAFILDGFTLTWTKVGSPTGTATIYWEAEG